MENTLHPLSRETSDFRRRLLDLMLQERSLLVRIGSTAIFAALLGLALPYASQVALDSALPDASPRLLVVVAVSVVILVAHQAAGLWIVGSSRSALSVAVEKNALAQVFSALVRSDYTRLQRHDSGWMTTTLGAAGTAVQRYVDSFVTLLTQGAFSIAYFLVLANASVSVAGLVLIANLLIAATCTGLARLEINHTRVLLERNGAQQQLMHVLMMGLASLRGMFAGERLGATWSDKVRGASLAALRSARAGALQGSVTATGSQALAIGIMIWAVYQCFEQQLSIGGMMFLITTSAGLSSALMSVIGVTVGLKALRPHFERVNELLAGARASTPVTKNFVASTNQLVMKNVSYRYSDNGRWVVHDHCWEVQEGQVVRLDSPSGSGKTTLLRLMAGLVPPSRGRVTVFGVDAVRARELVLYVPQHCKLFETSIRENLELLSGKSRADIARVATLIGLRRMLDQLPMAEETLVTAEGQNLSSGQRQLIVLTAAFASARPVLLLDEATNQIDAETRRACDWKALLQGRTVIQVEHA